MKYLLIPAVLSLAACSTGHDPYSMPNSQLITDKEVMPMSRTEIIMAVRECESNNLQAFLITSKRKVANQSTPVVIEVSCAPSYRNWALEPKRDITW
jgi:hypothetical protein